MSSSPDKDIPRVPVKDIGHPTDFQHLAHGGGGGGWRTPPPTADAPPRQISAVPPPFPKRIAPSPNPLGNTFSTMSQGFGGSTPSLPQQVLPPDVTDSTLSLATGSTLSLASRSADGTPKRRAFFRRKASVTPPTEHQAANKTATAMGNVMKLATLTTLKLMNVIPIFMEEGVSAGQNSVKVAEHENRSVDSKGGVLKSEGAVESKDVMKSNGVLIGPKDDVTTISEEVDPSEDVLVKADVTVADSRDVPMDLKKYIDSNLSKDVVVTLNNDTPLTQSNPLDVDTKDGSVPNAAVSSSQTTSPPSDDTSSKAESIYEVVAPTTELPEVPTKAETQAVPRRETTMRRNSALAALDSVISSFILLEYESDEEDDLRTESDVQNDPRPRLGSNETTQSVPVASSANAVPVAFADKDSGHYEDVALLQSKTRVEGSEIEVTMGAPAVMVRTKLNTDGKLPQVPPRPKPRHDVLRGIPTEDMLAYLDSFYEDVPLVVEEKSAETKGKGNAKVVKGDKAREVTVLGAELEEIAKTRLTEIEKSTKVLNGDSEGTVGKNQGGLDNLVGNGAAPTAGSQEISKVPVDVEAAATGPNLLTWTSDTCARVDDIEDKELRKLLQKAGVTDGDLTDKDTRDFIVQFINEHGGKDRVKMEAMFISTLAARPNKRRGKKKAAATVVVDIDIDGGGGDTKPDSSTHF